MKHFRITLLEAACCVLVGSAIGLALAFLTGCATVPQPNSKAQFVYALEGQYAAALAVGVAYVELPRCPSMRNGMCSDEERVRQLRLATTTAGHSIKAAEAAVRGKGDTIGALIQAQAAVESLSSLTDHLKVRP